VALSLGGGAMACEAVAAGEPAPPWLVPAAPVADITAAVVGEESEPSTIVGPELVRVPPEIVVEAAGASAVSVSAAAVPEVVRTALELVWSVLVVELVVSVELAIDVLEAGVTATTSLVPPSTCTGWALVEEVDEEDESIVPLADPLVTEPLSGRLLIGVEVAADVELVDAAGAAATGAGVLLGGAGAGAGGGELGAGDVLGAGDAIAAGAAGDAVLEASDGELVAGEEVESGAAATAGAAVAATGAGDAVVAGAGAAAGVAAGAGVGGGGGAEAGAGAGADDCVSAELPAGAWADAGAGGCAVLEAISAAVRADAERSRDRVATLREPYTGVVDGAPSEAGELEP
jgi:hypothetical protein